jgi:low affinity Fe/Cu permease
VSQFQEQFTQIARTIERASGSVYTSAIALAVIVVWALTGPLFKFSDTWQLVINTGTTIITFLMVFLIQHTQTRDTQAIHIKLDELLKAEFGARTSLVLAEELDQQSMDEIKQELQDEARLDDLGNDPPVPRRRRGTPRNAP